MRDVISEDEGYDLQALYAEQAKPFRFRWADRWWQLPHPKMLDFTTQAAVESFDYEAIAESDGDLNIAVAKVDELFTLIMGKEQGAEWAKVEVRPLQMILDLFSKWMESAGVKQGEAQASAGSSKSTGRPSRRTSKGSTASASPKPSRQDKATPGRRAKAADVKAAIQLGNS